MSNSMRSLRRIKTNSKDAVLSRIPSSSLPASALFDEHVPGNGYIPQIFRHAFEGIFRGLLTSSITQPKLKEDDLKEARCS